MSEEKQHGYFIVFEGPDRCGKSTQARKLAESLHNVQLFKDPGDTAVGDKIRDILKAPDLNIPQISEALLFGAARDALMKQKVIPALNNGDTVICDRLNDSTAVYQCFVGGVDWNLMKSMNLYTNSRFSPKCSPVCADQWEPDVTIYMDASVETMKKRKGGNTDRFDDAEDDYLERVREGFFQVCNEKPEEETIWIPEEFNEACPSCIHRMIWRSLVEKLPEIEKEQRYVIPRQY